MSVSIENAGLAKSAADDRPQLGPNGAEPTRAGEEDPELGPRFDDDTVRRWFALAVRSRCEKGVELELERRGVETFLPLRRERRMWRDRIKEVELALFPGYVFVRSSMVGRERYSVVDLVDVMEVVGHSRERVGVPIPDVEIESVRLLASRAEAVEPCAALSKGARVRVGLGPLRGVEGVIEEGGEGKRRIVCAITLLGRAVRAKIDPDHLLPID